MGIKRAGRCNLNEKGSRGVLRLSNTPHNHFNEPDIVFGCLKEVDPVDIEEIQSLCRNSIIEDMTIKLLP